MKWEIEKNGNQWPAAREALKRISANVTYHNEWGVRQPLGMYNISITRLPREFALALDALIAFTNFPVKGGGAQADKAADQLTDCYRALLYAMNEHAEDCDNIAKTFFPKDKFTGKESSLRNFRGMSKPYRERLNKIVNAMKHRQARLSLFHATNAMIRIPGYSIQSLIAPNTIGPDIHVHHKKRSSDVAATSFSYDFRWHICAFYGLGWALSRFIEDVTGTHTPEMKDAATPRENTPQMFDVVSRVAKLPTFVFPQEVRGLNPVVDTNSDHSRCRIEISESAKPRPLTFGQLPGGPITLTARYTGDGATTSFKVP